MKKLATKLTPAILAWIKEDFGFQYYIDSNDKYFHFPNFIDLEGFNSGYHIMLFVCSAYTEVSEQEFLAEFGNPKVVFQYQIYGRWVDVPNQDSIRIKPTPDYSTEIEALNKKANENGMKAVITFEKL